MTALHQRVARIEGALGMSDADRTAYELFQRYGIIGFGPEGAAARLRTLLDRIAEHGGRLIGTDIEAAP